MDVLFLASLLYKSKIKQRVLRCWQNDKYTIWFIKRPASNCCFFCGQEFDRQLLWPVWPPSCMGKCVFLLLGLILQLYISFLPRNCFETSLKQPGKTNIKKFKVLNCITVYDLQHKVHVKAWKFAEQFFYLTLKIL